VIKEWVGKGQWHFTHASIKSFDFNTNVPLIKNGYSYMKESKVQVFTQKRS